MPDNTPDYTAKRQAVYDAIKDDYNVGDWEEFNGKLAQQQQAPAPAPERKEKREPIKAGARGDVDGNLSGAMQGIVNDDSNNPKGAAAEEESQEQTQQAPAQARQQEKPAAPAAKAPLDMSATNAALAASRNSTVNAINAIGQISSALTGKKESVFAPQKGAFDIGAYQQRQQEQQRKQAAKYPEMVSRPSEEEREQQDRDKVQSFLGPWAGDDGTETWAQEKLRDIREQADPSSFTNITGNTRATGEAPSNVSLAEKQEELDKTEADRATAVQGISDFLLTTKAQEIADDFLGDADSTFLNMYKEAQKGIPQDASTFANQATFALANQAREKVIQQYLTKVPDIARAVQEAINSSWAQNAIQGEAQRLGIDPDYLTTDVTDNLRRDMLSRIRENMQRRLMEESVPKSDAEYIIRSVMSSATGQLYAALAGSGRQNAYAQAGMQSYGANAGVITNAAATGVKFGADWLLMKGIGKGVSLGTQGLTAAQVARISAATGMTSRGVSSALDTWINSTFGTKLGAAVLQRMVGSGMTLGVYNGISALTNQAAAGYFNPGEIAGQTAEGFMNGAVFGTVDGVVGTSTAKLENMGGIFSAAALGARITSETAAFTLTDQLTNLITGQDLRPWPQAIGESFATVVALKLSSPEGWGELAKTYRHMTDRAQAQADGYQGPTFTADEKRILKEHYGTNTFLQALLKAETKWGRNAAARTAKDLYRKGGELDRKADALQKSYDDLMNDPDVPFTVKQKIALLGGGVLAVRMPAAASRETTGNTVCIRDINGNLISAKTIKDAKKRAEYEKEADATVESEFMSAVGKADPLSWKETYRTLKAAGMSHDELMGAMDRIQRMNRAWTEYYKIMATKDAPEDIVEAAARELIFAREALTDTDRRVAETWETYTTERQKAAAEKMKRREDKVREETNKDTGDLVTVTVKGDDRPTFVVSGRVVLDEKGEIDLEKSDETLIIAGQTGEKRMIPTADLEKVVGVDDPEEAADEQVPEVNAEVDAETDVKNEYEKNQIVKINVGGQWLDVGILDIDEEGNVTIATGVPVQENTDPETHRSVLVPAEEGQEGTTEVTLSARDFQNLVYREEEKKENRPPEGTTTETTTGESTADEGVKAGTTTRPEGNGPDGPEGPPPPPASGAAPVEKEEGEEPKPGVNPQGPQTPEEPKQTALSKIPTTKDKDGETVYLWEQSDPDTVFDALIERNDGDADAAAESARMSYETYSENLKKLEKSKPKKSADPLKNAAAIRERKNKIEEAKKAADFWKKVSEVKTRREQDAQIAEYERQQAEAKAAAEKAKKEKEEKEEKERQEREKLQGVPNFDKDTPKNARKRGFKNVEGTIVYRQDPVPAVTGNAMQINFGQGMVPEAHMALVEADQLQPSHLQGQPNMKTFIPDAQPKREQNATRQGAARMIAKNIRPEEITQSATAYNGTPVTNARGEVIQGNNRTDALKYMYSYEPESTEAYKQYLREHAEQWGLKPEDIDSMQKPVLVRIIDCSDEEAVTYGQKTAFDTETGPQHIDPATTVRKFTADEFRPFLIKLLASDNASESIEDVISRNGVDALKWAVLNTKDKAVTQSQLDWATDKDGKITQDGKTALKKMISFAMFRDAPDEVVKMFEQSCPASMQRAMYATLFRDYASPKKDRIMSEMYNVIRLYHELSNYSDGRFAKAHNPAEVRSAITEWASQLTMGADAEAEGHSPADDYSKFALTLVEMFRNKPQSYMQRVLNDLFDCIQGVKADDNPLFAAEEGGTEPKSLDEAVQDILQIEYDGQREIDENPVADNLPQGDEGGSGGGTTPQGGERTSQEGAPADGETGNNEPSGQTENKPKRKGERQIQGCLTRAASAADRGDIKDLATQIMRYDNVAGGAEPTKEENAAMDVYRKTVADAGYEIVNRKGEPYYFIDYFDEAATETGVSAGAPARIITDDDYPEEVAFVTGGYAPELKKDGRTVQHGKWIVRQGCAEDILDNDRKKAALKEKADKVEEKRARGEELTDKEKEILTAQAMVEKSEALKTAEDKEAEQKEREKAAARRAAEEEYTSGRKDGVFEWDGLRTEYKGGKKNGVEEKVDNGHIILHQEYRDGQSVRQKRVNPMALHEYGVSGFLPMEELKRREYHEGEEIVITTESGEFGGEPVRATVESVDAAGKVKLRLEEEAKLDGQRRGEVELSTEDLRMMELKKLSAEGEAEPAKTEQPAQQPAAPEPAPKPSLDDFRSGRVDGVYEYETGRGKARVTFKGGKEEGEYTVVNDDGIVVEKGQYAAGKKEGTWETNLADGTPFITTEYRNGKKNGQEIRRFPNGTVEKTVNWKDDVIDGALEKNDADGKPVSRAVYKDGKRHGRQYVYENGKPVSMTEYKDGKQHGLQEEYDKDGNVTARSVWNNGTMIARINPGEGLHLLTEEQAGKRKYAKGEEITVAVDGKTVDATVTDVDKDGNVTIKTSEAVSFADGLRDGSTRHMMESRSLGLREVPVKKDKARQTFTDPALAPFTVDSDFDGESEVTLPNGNTARVSFSLGKPRYYDEKYPSGELAVTGSYSDDGQRNDVWRYYDENGKETKGEIYHAGELRFTRQWGGEWEATPEYAEKIKAGGKNPLIELIAKQKKIKLSSSEIEKLSLEKYLSDDPARPVLGGLYYRGGYVYACDAHTLVRVSVDYPKKYEGKTLLPYTTIEEGGKYPDAGRVMEEKFTRESGYTEIPLDEVLRQTAAVKKLLAALEPLSSIKRGYYNDISYGMDFRTDYSAEEVKQNSPLHIDAERAEALENLLKNIRNARIFTNGYNLEITGDGVQALLMGKIYNGGTSYLSLNNGRYVLSDVGKKNAARTIEEAERKLASMSEKDKKRPALEKAVAALKDIVEKAISPEEAEKPATTEEAVEKARRETDTNPTPAQIEAGNYKKGHVNIGGLDISIENPKGSERKGTDPNGKAWSVTMQSDYGYIRGAEGNDGDQMDIFLSDHPDEGGVYVVDQVNPQTGDFDEHKIMYGYPDIDAAKEAYLANYEKGWKGLGNITETTREELKDWLADKDARKTPFAEYKEKKGATEETEIAYIGEDGSTGEKRYIAKTRPDFESVYKNVREELKKRYPDIKTSTDGAMTFSEYMTLLFPGGSILKIRFSDHTKAFTKKEGPENYNGVKFFQGRNPGDVRGTIDITLNNMGAEDIMRFVDRMANFDKNGWPGAMLEKINGNWRGTTAEGVAAAQEFGMEIPAKKIRAEAENPNILMREGPEDTKRGKSLVGVHNITAAKLRKALRLGGLANPSVAVIDLNKGTHTDFGEISLLMPASMVDSRTGRNSGTSYGDAWTPVVPDIAKRPTGKGATPGKDIAKLPKIMQAFTSGEIYNWSVGEDADLSYMFLSERGEAPEPHNSAVATNNEAKKYIKGHNLEGEYDDWLAGLNERYGYKDVIYTGRMTPSGEPGYTNADLKGISKYMNQQRRSGEGHFGGSAAELIAGLLPKGKSLEDIRKNRDKLQGDADKVFEERRKYESRFIAEVGDVAKTIGKDGYVRKGSETWKARTAVEQSLFHPDPKKYLKSEFGEEISDRDNEKLKALVKGIRENYPAKYFETKFERPVKLNEFVTAVVPEGTDEKLVQALKDAGLNVITYGSAEERQRKIEEAAADERLRFSENGTRKTPVKDTPQQAVMRKHGEKLTKALHLDNVEFINDSTGLEGRQAGAKGWYDTRTGRITINLSRHTSLTDLEKTILHEAAGHHGMRELFGGEYDKFLHHVYNNVSEGIRAKINEKISRNDWNYLRATDEYLAELTEGGFEEHPSLWQQVKKWFTNLLEKCGFRHITKDNGYLGAGRLTDNDLRYILKKAYENLKNPRPDLVEQARDVVRQMDMKVGNFRPDDDDIRYRETEPEERDDREKEKDATRAAVVLNSRLKALEDNHNDVQARKEVIDSLPVALGSIRQAMRAQRVYDKAVVNNFVDLVKRLLQDKIITDPSPGETQRLFTRVKDVMKGMSGYTSKNPKDDVFVARAVNKLFDMVADNLIRTEKNSFTKALSEVKLQKLDAHGAPMQGQVDQEGMNYIKAIQKYLGRLTTEDQVDAKVEELQEDLASGVTGAREAAAPTLAALEVVRKHIATVEEKYEAMDAIDKEVDEALEKVYKTRQDPAFLEYLDKQLVKKLALRLEIADAWNELRQSVTTDIQAAVQRAKDFAESEKRRVTDIHSLVEKDLGGEKDLAHRDDTVLQNIVNHPFVRFFFSPLATFDEVFRELGRKLPNGEGWLWNRFVRGWVDAANAKARGMNRATSELDEKVAEVFGKKKMLWSDLYTIERSAEMKKNDMTVEWFDGERKVAHKLSQGNMLYIYMVNKMTDGAIKLRRMGISEQDVAVIKEHLDPRFVELADWLQNDYLQRRRADYNEVYKKMFNTPMDAIENYFPLKILGNARYIEEQLHQENGDEAPLPAKLTGALIRRKYNTLPLDILHADAFSVVIEHIQQMEDWAAFAPFRRDMCTLLSYNKFKNTVQNLTTVYGGGKTLLHNVRTTCLIACGSYRPAVGQYGIDSLAVNLSKGVTQAKIALRIFTALKQITSVPAFWPATTTRDFCMSAARPWEAWKWSMENMPLFKKRLATKQAGDTRLMQTSSDWKFYYNDIYKKLARLGMSPNAFFDAAAIAVGSKAVYDTNYRRYVKEDKLSPEAAHKKAVEDAVIVYNETQQSSENAWVSAIQLDRTWLATIATTFRNASMAYTRRVVNDCRTMKRLMTPGKREETLRALAEIAVENNPETAFLKKQLESDIPGMASSAAERMGELLDGARASARKKYGRMFWRAASGIATFGFLLPAIWNATQYMPYLMAGKDDEKKKKLLEDAVAHALTGGPIEGLPFGQQASDLTHSLLSGQGLGYFSTTVSPLLTDIAKITDEAEYDKWQALNDLANELVQMGIGANPGVLADVAAAVVDASAGDPFTAREAMYLGMRIAQMPQGGASQGTVHGGIDDVYFDEIDLGGEEARRLSPKEIAERYAVYKVRRNSFLTQKLYSDEEWEKALDRQRKRAVTVEKDVLSKQGGEELNDAFLRGEKDFKEYKTRMQAKLRESSAGLKKGTKAYKEARASFRGTSGWQMMEEADSLSREINDGCAAWLDTDDPAEAVRLERRILNLKQRYVQLIQRLR